MFAARLWLVAFLSFSITLQKAPAGFMAPTTVMAIGCTGYSVLIDLDDTTDPEWLTNLSLN